MPNEKSDLKINRLSPILAVPDIRAAVDFYTRVLGFELDWLWQDPPVHGAVHSANVQIQFGLSATRAERAPGTQFFLFVNDVEKFHALHRGNGAEIISRIENKPWGIREYTVRDPWGYELRFAGPEKYEKPSDAQTVIPSNIRIVERMPTVEEYLAIVKSVNWSGHVADIVATALKRSVYGVIAVDESDSANPKTIGMLRMIGDGAMAFCIQDVAVMPSHQNQRIGTALLETALKSVPPGAFVCLFTLKPSFYERLGFQNEGGMHRKA
jgi:catechol 2,3-dioxygenase-like lactoylglutathione lyase family enzyme/ribosomal protein S18 acetylase RimI-like enzyme